MSQYTIDRAPSGRATCQGSKEKIAKGEIRMSVSTDKAGEYTVQRHWKLNCFKLPRKFKSFSIPEFVEEEVTIKEEDEIELEEVLKLLQEAEEKKIVKKAVNGEESGEETLMDKIRVAAELLTDEPKKKKVKSEAKTEGTALPEDFDKLAREYKTLMEGKPKVDELKDLLRWNKQVLKGKKDFLVFKVIDGRANGRLGHCALDGGKLKIVEENCSTVASMGMFDEATNTLIPSSFSANRTDARLSRLKWFDQKPTEEEEEELKKLAEDAKNLAGGSGGDSGEGSPMHQELLDAAEQIEDWDLKNKAKMKGALKSLKAIGKGKIAFPEGNRVNTEIGSMLLKNRDKSAKEIMEFVISKYGLKEAKAKLEAAKVEMMETACTNPNNAKLLAAFVELSNLYFKDANPNTGATYKKVANLIKDMSEEVTAKNAMSFSKGKAKIPGIGPSSGKKMKEFCETGTMEKLEEKRKLVG